ncbi:hypothetical protein [Xanthomonas nasturtii]|nr:hypothetical protein [Xanthomonas nasturtii]WVL56465.1 hypothetical protein M3O54_019480 [Xanthomonas nasturtii]
MKLGDARLRGILVTIHTWNAGKANPISSIPLAIRERDINQELIGGGDE